MKNQRNMKLVLLILYCIPFTFLAVNGDAVYGTMLFYGIMIAGFALLCRYSLKTSNEIVIYIGNVFSFISSYAVAKMSGLEPMGHYFKPFTAYSLIVTISVITFLLQIILVKVNKKR